MKILKRQYFIMIIIFIFTTPRFFNSYTPVIVIGNLIQYIRYIISLVVIVYYFSNLKISKFILGVVVFYISYFVSIIYNSGDIILYLKQMVTIIGFSIILEFYIKNYTKEFVDALFYTLFIYVFINFVFLIIKPEGFQTLITYSNDRIFNQTDRVNFIEVDNRIIMTVLPLIAISVVYKEENKIYKKIMSILAILISITTEIFMWSVTGIISICIIMVYILFYKNENISKLFKFNNLIIIHFFMIIYMLIGNQIESIKYIITQILKRDITFSGRTYIWESAFEYISQSPILGHGNYKDGWIILWRGIERNAHNFYLDLLIQGGLCLFIAFILIMMILKCKLNKLYKTKYAGLMAILILSTFTYMIGESNFFSVYLCLILCMANNVEYFNRLDDNKII